MAINGIRTIQNGKYIIFFIESFSDELQELIRSQLQGIFHGFSEYDSLDEYYSYQNTLKSFLDRYNSKDNKSKKGIIGELLAHIILNHELVNFKSLSILKNKEERQVKKGFDIIYYNTDNIKLWYTEVKSGNKRSSSSNCSEANTILLNRSKKSISEMIDEKRQSLWDSALIDVRLMIKQEEGLLDIRKVLANDSPNFKSDQKKRVILISVLYSELSELIEEISISDFTDKAITEDNFEDIIVISIQKRMFETIATFLTTEVA
ncbi:Hachiman antiphage defense system protein HamA [Chryseobacterium pennipullorum]|uniref:Anti-bacteriophage protein A/HamA C-terminal domain-containing protein n=1 Tax=Chryseobacterium pennipullorum TaxID=2258963 RepID=A0A3D9B4W4_9FLAO|nr:Hachiman antiphage defense system protein HamA [Chryseobacterium pennipullorum]REC48549.1 hypothetical protein DRF67_06940 [Chryseobacterium pennipullorum]